AKSRIDPDAVPLSTSTPPVFMESSVAVSVARVVNGVEILSPTTIAEWIRELCADVPIALSDLVGSALAHLAMLPVDQVMRTSISPRMPDSLPSWMPARRTLGGFYVVKALGTGGAGSVFVCNRVEDRHDPDAEKFALKVPDYSASAARLISEAEFQ